MLNSISLMPRRTLTVATACFSLLGIAGSLSAQSVHLMSGNGPGPQDTQITYLLGDPTDDFPTLGPADFAAAQAGPNAYILTTLSPYWAASLPGSSAQWVGTGGTDVSDSQNSALYAINFDWAQTTVNTGLDITFSCDDQLGGSNNVGMFIDGNGIANSSSNVDWDGNIETYDLSLGTLAAGTHTLYFDNVNSGGQDAGIIFDATVLATPEPTPIAVLAVGAVGLYTRRKKR